MFTPRFSPDNELTREATVALAYRPSIGELYFTDEPSEDERREIVPTIVSTSTCRWGQVEAEYGLTEDGGAIITHCCAAEPHVSVPTRVEGHDVVAIGPHAFSSYYALESVSLPDTVVAIYEFSFMNTALSTFKAPCALEHIGRKAFFKCERLTGVDLGSSVAFIGEAAFCESGLERLEIPSSVTYLGRDIVKDSRVVCAGPNATLSLARDNAHFVFEGGALYHVAEDGLELVQVLDKQIERFKGKPGVVRVLPKAFAGSKRLQEVVLPMGTVSIGEAAFRHCGSLRSVSLPDSLESVGRRAFWETSLESVRIPASLKTVGAAAFYTGDTIVRRFKPSIKHIEVSPENTMFYMEGNMLCQRRGDAGPIVLLYAGSDDEIVIPKNVTAIGPYAFTNITGVRALYIHDGIKTIDVGGLDFEGAIASVVYESSTDGRTYLVHYPPGEAGRRGMKQTFSRGTFDIRVAYRFADNAILTTQDVYIGARGMLERLMDDTLLEPKTARLFKDRLRILLPHAVVEFGRNGYLQGIDLLLEVGTLNEQTMEIAMEAAVSAGEVAVISRLMEIRRTEFGAPMFDFDL